MSIDLAREKMAKSLIDLCKFKVTVPLTEKTKNIHTNSFIYFEPLHYSNMDVMDNIYTQMGKSKATRWTAYRKGYWYVTNVQITYSNSEQKMELTLSPFPTVFDAQDMSSKNTTTSNSGTQNKTTKVVKKNKLSIDEALDEVGKKWKHIKYSHCCQSASATRKNGAGDCWGMSFLLACELKKRGVTVRILNYPTSMSNNHRSVQYKDGKGKWRNFPYRKYGFHSWFYDTNGVNQGRVINVNCG